VSCFRHFRPNPPKLGLLPSSSTPILLLAAPLVCGWRLAAGFHSNDLDGPGSWPFPSDSGVGSASTIEPLAPA